MNAVGGVMPRRVRVTGDLYHGTVPAGAYYIGRGAPGLPQSPFHNPFKPSKTPGCHSPEDAVRMYERWMRTGDTPDGLGERAARRLVWVRIHARSLIKAGELDGRDLACWCREGQPCHGLPLLNLVQEIRTLASTGGAR